MPDLHYFPNFPSVIAHIYCPYSKLCILFSNEKIFTYSVAFNFLNRQSMWDSKLYILDVATKLQSFINPAQRILKANWTKGNFTQTNLKEEDVREDIFSKVYLLYTDLWKTGDSNPGGKEIELVFRVRRLSMHSRCF